MNYQGKMAVLFGMAAEALRNFLEQVLPTGNEDWWQDFVLNSLSFQQRRMVDQNSIATLAQLDFAALLRVLDQNWHRLGQNQELLSSDRNFVKEMFSVRNRWAHVSTIGFSEDDLYRDLDTMQRFGKVIQGDAHFLDAVETAKAELRQPTPKQPAVLASVSPQPTTEFVVGEIVCLVSDPSVTGAVVSIIPSNPENRYAVFHDGTTETYYASQLQGSDSETAPDWRTLSEFHAGLSALQICHPSLTTLYSLNTATIDFAPYQYRPVLKFIRSDRPRLLIADGVGVGKTIEAGLILRELQARGDVRRVMVICPKPLVVERKWELELKRFDERFVHLDGKQLRYCLDEMDLDGEWSDQYNKCIVPFSLFDSTLLHGNPKRQRNHRKGLLDLDPPPHFDLVIVDEAHRIRNPNTYLHEGVRFFCERAEAVVFLTATPIQLGSDDLFVLLNTLRPDLIVDRQSYDHMAKPNPKINIAIDLVRTQPDNWQIEAREALHAAAETQWGKAFFQDDPEFQRVYDLLDSESLNTEERIDVITTLEQKHTFSGIVNRTRRRDIGQFTKRRPETIEVEFTSEQKALHDEILRVQATIFSRLHDSKSIKFMMTTIRRQAASCLFGLIPLLSDILTRRLDEISLVDTDEYIDDFDDVDCSSIETQVQAVLEMAKRLPPEDPKLNALIQAITDKQTLSNNKVMVFSSFRHTLSYLHRNLQAGGWRTGLVHGGVPDDERVTLRNRFRLAKDDSEALDVLLFSEVGCEGLDYEFCDCMINYDLPWNPMRVEQRIGRIDRRGQKSEHVTICNLITPGTVDADIYHRCLERIGIFEQEIGGNEQILGEISQEIHNIAENPTLSPAEQAEKLQQLADNQIRQIRDQQELEERQHEFFGLRLPDLQSQTDIDEATSYWLSPLAVQNLVEQYLKQVSGKQQDQILGEKSLKTLRLSQEARERLLQDLRALPRKRAFAHRKWEEWLKGSDPHLTITFESSCAVDHPEADLIMPVHPLVQQAANAVQFDSPLLTRCDVLDDALPAGEHPFAIYQWQFKGIREDVQLRAVSTSSQLTEGIMKVMSNCKPSVNECQGELSDSFRETLEENHYPVWQTARNQHRERVLQLAEFRKHSLKASHEARMALLGEQLEQATEEKIRRMRQAQLANAEADYNRRMQELDDAATRADIRVKLVAYGILRVQRNEVTTTSHSV